jgi:hypothetical protein
MIVTSIPVPTRSRIASCSARPSVTLPPALLMYKVIGRRLSLASSRRRSMDGARAVLVDVADQINVPQPVGLFFPKDVFDCIDEFR